MIDPVGVSLSLVTLLGVITKALYTFVQFPKLVDEAIRSLIDETEILFHVIESLDRSLRDPCSGDVRNGQSQSNKEHYRLIERTLKDCQGTMKTVESTLWGIQAKQNPLVNRLNPRIQYKKIIALRDRIVDHCQKLILSLNILSTFISPFTRTHRCFSSSTLTFKKHYSHASPRSDALTTETPSTPNLGVEDPSAACIIRNSESIALVATRPNVDKDNFIRVTRRAIEIATLQFDCKDYSSVQELLEGTLSQAEMICGTDFDGRLKILELLGASYCKQDQWPEARDTLQKLVKEGHNISQVGTDALEAMLTLAENGLEQKEFNEAENWCREAMLGIKAHEMLGEQHVSYYHSLYLLVEILEEQGRDVEANGFKDLLQKPSFHDYVHTGDKRAVELLVNQMSQEDLDAALIVAAHSCHDRIFRLLLDKGANIEPEISNEEPALIIAATNGHADFVKLLIKNGANINVENSDGETSLMLAVVNGHRNVVHILLQEGADVAARNRNMLTAMDLAKREGKKDILKMIKRQKVKGMTTRV